ncbi:MAG: type pilus assembly protein PilE [Burkholderiales bacterium]|jgi:type IV pilus assembly protein PilE
MNEPIKQSAGFTLVELMIAVVVLGVLAGMAYPSYREHMRKGRRAEAKTALMSAAQALERYYTENGKYADAPSSVFPTATYYTLSFASGQPTATTFAIRAAPAVAQSGDKCGTYTLNHLGEKGVANATATVTACW